MVEVGKDLERRVFSPSTRSSTGQLDVVGPPTDTNSTTSPVLSVKPSLTHWCCSADSKTNLFVISFRAEVSKKKTTKSMSQARTSESFLIFLCLSRLCYATIHSLIIESLMDSSKVFVLNLESNYQPRSFLNSFILETKLFWVEIDRRKTPHHHSQLRQLVN